jgi:hypothetical protein
MIMAYPLINFPIGLADVVWAKEHKSSAELLIARQIINLIPIAVMNRNFSISRGNFIETKPQHIEK